jgi:hypothetical protein
MLSSNCWLRTERADAEGIARKSAHWPLPLSWDIFVFMPRLLNLQVKQG